MDICSASDWTLCHVPHRPRGRRTMVTRSMARGEEDLGFVTPPRQIRPLSPDESPPIKAATRGLPPIDDTLSN